MRLRDVNVWMEGCRDLDLIYLRSNLAAEVARRNATDPVGSDDWLQGSDWEPWKVARQHWDEVEVSLLDFEPDVLASTGTGYIRQLMNPVTGATFNAVIEMHGAAGPRVLTSTLTHELVHFWRGIPPCDVDPATRAAEEATVRAITRDLMARYEPAREGHR